jgi:hypothetical protein
MGVGIMRAVILACELLIATLMGMTATADAAQIAIEIASADNSPALLERCAIAATGLSAQSRLSIQNRSYHHLLAVNVHYSFYDGKKVLLAQITSHYTAHVPIVSAGVQQFEGPLLPIATEPLEATAYVTCRIDVATFTGVKPWHYGQRWREPLVPKSPGSSDAFGASQDNSTRLEVRVLNAWSDPAPSYETGYYIHERIAVSGATQSVSIHANDFALKARTVSGELETVNGLASAAPTYMKYNYLRKENIATPEVASNEDLGALGSLNVSANERVVTVVTFYIPNTIDRSSISDVVYP